MKEFSVAMALTDFVPVVLFTWAGVLMMRDLYNKMSKGAFALLAAGLIDVTAAGGLKALYKLLYAAGICDFTPLSAMFFPVQALGFLLTGVGLLAMMLHRQGKNAVYAAAPPVFSGTFIFVGMMVAGIGIISTVFSILAKKLGKPALCILFIIAFFGMLSMGYLSSRDFDKASMNWIAEGVNILAQGSLLLGVFQLHKAGLASLQLEKGAHK